MIAKRQTEDKWVNPFSWQDQLLVMIYGQLALCDSLRKVRCTCNFSKNKRYFLGFNNEDNKLSNLVNPNVNQDYNIFEKFVFHIISIAQSRRIKNPSELCRKFYAFDSSTKDLHLSLFEWIFCKKNNNGIKVHKLFDVIIQIPAYVHITEAKVQDVNPIVKFPYESYVFYIFDKGYYDLARFYRINTLDSCCVIRQKSHLNHEIADGEEYVVVITFWLCAIVENDFHLDKMLFYVPHTNSRILNDKTSHQKSCFNLRDY